jgi:hypothetical protein
MTMTSRMDMDAIGALSPRAVVAYLESRGWKRVAAYGEYGALVARTINNEQHELIVRKISFERCPSLFLISLRLRIGPLTISFVT